MSEHRTEIGLTVVLRLRMGKHDAHYGGDLVDGARMLGLFGDVATELLIRLDVDEGLFRAYDAVDFLSPVFAGDYIEAQGTITRLTPVARWTLKLGRSSVPSQRSTPRRQRYSNHPSSSAGPAVPVSPQDKQRRPA